ncbi:hypothetical protein [Radiobacillus deserti]|uniref:Uncharacterized protein n=1 Tax=Radiobacillus deserti TaxID=2594883 RepID=A0A516KG95_9BACI|nr:hypothetical protein [Radiobacillus deserti]QDP40366.1 hypothetical protein FN924_09355 [Radiobacillus deserti]
MKNLKSQYVIGGLLIVNLILIISIAILLFNNYFLSKELNNLTAKCYENGGTVKMEIQSLSKGQYHFECLKD